MIDTRALTRTALLLALAIASQFLKNVSVYITGPFINCVIVLAVLSCGLVSGLLISIVTPVTSFIITGSPIMSALPLVIPCVMLGNAVLAACVYFLNNKNEKLLIPGLILGAVCKAAVMGLTISVAVIGLMGESSGLPQKALETAKVTFSLTQLITASIGCAAAFPVWKAIKTYIERGNR